EADLRRAAEVLNAGNKVAILAGAGALHATDELIEVANTLGAGLAKALLGKAAVPDDLPFVTGCAGWLGTRASNEMLAECDTLLNPQRVVWELSARLPDNALIAGDSGSSTVWYARDLRMRRGMRATLSGTLATMGSALPYALAAKVAYPDRPAIAILGDGAM